MPKITLTNMIMIQNPTTKKVLVQNRIKSWKGLAFPGGHIEDDESVVDSAIREVKEETGLDVRNLQSCGLVHWLNRKTLERYWVFLFKTSDYSGELIANSDEGQHFWIDVEEMSATPTENHIHKYLPMFLEGKYNELFLSWGEENETLKVVYK